MFVSEASKSEAELKKVTMNKWQAMCKLHSPNKKRVTEKQEPCYVSIATSTLQFIYGNMTFKEAGPKPIL